MNPRLSPRIARLAATIAFVSAVAGAQVARRVPTGEVSGVDLQIDGRTVAAPGRPLRLVFTAFEVLGLDRIRRAPNTQIQVFTSFERERAAASVSTDAHGRALVEVAVPEDLEGGFSVVVEARTRSRVVRRFEFPVSVQETRALRVALAPSTVFPGSPLHAAGRLTNAITSAGIPGAELVVEVRGPNGPVGNGVRLVTDDVGAFVHTIPLPSNATPGAYRVEVRLAATPRITASASASVVPRTAPPLLVSVAASPPVVAPRAWVEVDVVVRRPDGRPVRGATVRTVTILDERTEATTDARGRAHLRYRTRTTGGLVDEPVRVEVEKAGLGTSQGGTTVRVTNARYVGRLSFEGGRFVEALGGRAYVRVVTVDGRPAPAGVPVVLEGPRVRGGRVAGATDAFGVATIDLALAPAVASDEESSDSCGGTIATEIVAQIGETAGEGRVARCLPVDPDGIVRIRTASPRARGGEAIAVHVDRAGTFGRGPVVLELLALGEDAFAGTILATTTIDASSNDGRLVAPADASGLLAIRARVLAGPDALELRGGSAVVLASRTDPYDITARYDREQGSVDVAFHGEPGEPVTAFALAIPYDVALGMFGGFDPGSQMVSPRSETADDIARGESWFVADLADRVPTDRIAAHGYVERVVTPLPGPESPEQEGRLRDPYRARARFVTGRLGLLFRALESFVDQSVPGNSRAVAHVENGRMVFNDAVLSAVASDGELGAEGATGLGGAPITIAQLRTIDPTFGYDAVARRVTRKRLFALLINLRRYVTNHGFDLAWAIPGDPRVFLEQMIREGDYSYGDGLAERDMVDGWGRPFQLVPTRAARFGMIQPLAGFELVSAGPDGRYGNGDDVFDPTSRVLPEGSVYAASVLEDALVARLRGVELSRATLSQITEMFGIYVSAPSIDREVDSVSAISAPSDRFPSILVADPDPLAIRRVAQTIPSVLVGPVHLDSGHSTIPVDLGSEPRSWGVFVYTYSPSSGPEVSLARATSGTAILAHGELPARLGEDEPLSVELAATNVSSSDRTVALRASGCEGLAIDVPPSLAIAAETSASIRATLRATRVGRCDARIDFVDGDRVLARVARPIEVASGQHPERRRVVALVDARGESLDVAAPRGTSRVVGRVTVADPSSLVDLPEMSEIRSTYPALVAWARVASGRAFDDALRDEVLRSFEDPSRSPTSLAKALAVVALSERVEDEASRNLRNRLLASLDSLANDAVAAADPGSAHRRMVAACVATLAIAGVPDPDAESSSDPIGRAFRRLLPMLRASVRAEVASVTELAFPAAALLLADSHDGHGRSLYDRAFAASVLTRGVRVLASAPGHEPAEGIAATLAMAIASHELGRTEDAVAFARAALRELPSLARASEDSAFWVAAVSVYGTLANDDVPEVVVSVDGHETRERLDGRLAIPFAIDAGSRVAVEVRVARGGFVVAEAEVAYERPFEAETNGPLRVAIEGDPGRAYGVAALELVVSASEPVFDPVVEIALPAAVTTDATLERALRGASGVTAVELRRAGFVRLALAPIGVGTELRIPLPFSFQAVGTVRGLAASAYPRSRSYARTVLPARTLELVAE